MIFNFCDDVHLTLHDAAALAADQRAADRRLEKEVILVGSAEADPTKRKLYESPIGSALVGHKRGDVVGVEVPRGPKRKLKITKIEAA